MGRPPHDPANRSSSSLGRRVGALLLFGALALAVVPVGYRFAGKTAAERPAPPASSARTAGPGTTLYRCETDGKATYSTEPSDCAKAPFPRPAPPR